MNKLKTTIIKSKNMSYNPYDYYFKKAKQTGYKARSIFKLEEIDEKYNINRITLSTFQTDFTIFYNSVELSTRKYRQLPDSF